MANHLNVPTTGTVGPGVNGVVLAVGADLPTELAAYAPYGAGSHVVSAVIHYNSIYSTSLTHPVVKYWWEGVVTITGTGDSTYMRGVVYVVNPHVSTTGIVKTLQATGFNVQPLAAAGFTVDHEFLSSAGTTQVLIEEDDANGDPVISVKVSNGNIAVQVVGNVTYNTAGDIGGAVSTFDANTSGLNTGTLPVFGP